MNRIAELETDILNVRWALERWLPDTVREVLEEQLGRMERESTRIRLERMKVQVKEATR